MNKELAFLLTYSLGRTQTTVRISMSSLSCRTMSALTGRDRGRARSTAFRPARYLRFRKSIAVAARLGFQALDKLSFAPIFSTGSGRPINALDSTDTLRTGAYPISARPFGLSAESLLFAENHDVDLRVMKTFPVHHNQGGVASGLEAFNLANHTNRGAGQPVLCRRGERLSSYGRRSRL